MGSQTLDIFRQGIWASLCGGWFYDPGLTLFANTFHLYIWIGLLCIPFSIHLVRLFIEDPESILPSNLLFSLFFFQSFPSPTFSIWSLYVLLLFLFFASVKILNARLHTMFDTQDCIEEEEEDPEDPDHDLDEQEHDENDHVCERGEGEREGKRALNASGGGRSRNLQTSRTTHRHQDTDVGIEMQVR